MGRVFRSEYVRPNFIDAWINKTLSEEFFDVGYYTEFETLGATMYGRDGD
jgi:hypothetical protein